MITQEQIKDLQGRVETLDRCLNMKGKRDELELKEKQSQAPDFWEDPKSDAGLLYDAYRENK